MPSHSMNAQEVLDMLERVKETAIDFQEEVDRTFMYWKDVHHGVRTEEPHELLEEGLDHILRGMMGMERAYVMLIQNLHNERCAMLQLQRETHHAAVDPVPEYTASAQDSDDS